MAHDAGVGRPVRETEVRQSLTSARLRTRNSQAGRALRTTACWLISLLVMGASPASWVGGLVLAYVGEILLPIV